MVGTFTLSLDTELHKADHGEPTEMTGFMGWYANTLTVRRFSCVAPSKRSIVVSY